MTRKEKYTVKVDEFPDMNTVAIEPSIPKIIKKLDRNTAT